MVLRPGRIVAFWDTDGDLHEALVIDVFERSDDAFGPYVNLVYNPDQDEFGANTLKQLEDETSVGHTLDEGNTEYSYTTETGVL